MAMYANQKRNPKRGIYPGSGVAQGGNTKRRKSLHMGTSTVKKKAGGRHATIGQKPIAVKPKAPSYPAATPGNLFGLNPGPGAKPGTAGWPTSASPGKPAAPGLPSIDYRNADYWRNIGQADLNFNAAGMDIPGLKAQLAANAARHATGLADLNKWNTQNTYDVNADLANRGLYFSGGRVNANVDRNAEFEKGITDLRTTVGDLANAGIQGNINAIEAQREAQRRFDKEQAETAAYNSYMATPQYSAPVAAPKPKPTGSKSGKVYKTGFIMQGGVLKYQHADGSLTRADQSKKGKVNLL